MKKNLTSWELGKTGFPYIDYDETTRCDWLDASFGEACGFPVS